MGTSRSEQFSPEERDLIALMAQEGHPSRDIAVLMGKPDRTTRKIVARQKLSGSSAVRPDLA